MINIQEIIPFMKKGWVAMDEDDTWWWHEKEPSHTGEDHWYNNGDCVCLYSFDIAPADDWTKSLIKIDNTAREKFEEEYQNNIQRTIKELNQDG